MREGRQGEEMGGGAGREERMRQREVTGGGRERKDRAVWRQGDEREYGTGHNNPLLVKQHHNFMMVSCLI